MDYQVIWSPEALEDVDAIADYIQKDSPLYAQAVVERTLAASRALGQNPLRGREVPELEDAHYRELFIYSYRLIYWVEKPEVKIAALIHGARRLENILDRFE